MNDHRLEAFMSDLSSDEYAFASRLREYGGDFALIYLAVHLDRRISTVSAPPWRGFGHAFGGFVGGLIAFFMGQKGIGG